MGNQQKTNNAKLLEIYDNFGFIQQINDSRYGDGKVMKSDFSDKIIFLKEYAFQDIQSYKNFLIQVDSSIVNSHQNIINILKVCSNESTQICGTVYKMHLLIEYIETSLENVVVQYFNQGQRFPEQQLWNIMIDAVNGLAHLESQNHPHQAVRPATISIRLEDGLVKISNTSLFNIPPSFNIVMYDYTQTVIGHYLSPKLVQECKFLLTLITFQALQERNCHPKHDQFKSDVFSLGMTILEAALVQPMNSIYSYDHRNPQIKTQLLTEALEQLSDQYSDEFCRILQKMLEFDEELRPNFIQLKKEIQFAPKVSKMFQQINKSHSFPKKSLLKQLDLELPIQPIELKNSVSLKSDNKNKFELDFQDVPEIQKENQLESSEQLSEKSSSSKRKHKIFSQSQIQSVSSSTSSLQRVIQFEQDSITLSDQEKVNQILGLNPIPIVPVTAIIPKNRIQMKSSHMDKTATSRHKKTKLQNSERKKWANQSEQQEEQEGSKSVRNSLIIDDSNSEKIFKTEQDQSSQMINQSQIEEQNCIKNGFLKFVYPNSYKYSGEWVDDKRHGEGILFFPNGKPCYDGLWKEDMYHGNGIEYNEKPQIYKASFNHKDFNKLKRNWIRYEGQFQNNEREGKGILYLTNDEKFEGMFKGGIISGPGQFHKKNGDVVKGKWKQNKLID